MLSPLHHKSVEGNMTQNIRRQGGFTLVEIAIVLVIIGLLLGGILKGQEMITQAKIKNVINDFNGISAAIYSYQDRYRALPGDEISANTVARWGAAAFGGDGNGTFCRTTTCAATDVYNNPPGATAATATTAEANLFWMHLRLSGFVPGPTAGAAAIQQPSNAVNGIVGVQTSGMGFTSNIVCTSNLPDKVAIAIDTQMDDGASNTGQVRSMLQTGPSPATGTAATAYSETGTNQYLACKNL
jgi:prepilin-type N-terminal cleavage/methylation domain-containing protein